MKYTDPVLPLAAMLTGCSAPTCAPGFVLEDDGYCEPADGVRDTGAASGDEAAQWTFDEAVAAIDAVFAMGFYGPVELKAAYLDLMQHGDDYCPGSDVEIYDTFVTGCVAESGYYYAGVSVYASEEWPGENSSAWSFGGDFEILDPSGNQMLVGGHTFGLYEDIIPEMIGGDITGSWSLSGAEGWLGEGISAMLLIDGVVGQSLSLTGGLGVGATAMYFPELSWSYPSCWDSPVGELQVRDPAGHWFSLVLNEDCTGCGEMTYIADGTTQEVCVALSGLGQEITEALVNQ